MTNVSTSKTYSGHYRSKSQITKARYQKPTKENFAKLAKQVRAITRKVKPMVNNYKWKSSPAGTVATTAVTSGAPFIQLLNGIAEGADETTRIGDLLRIVGLEMNIHFFNNNATILTPSAVRVLLVQEKTALGSAVAMAQLFNSATPSPWDVRNVTTRDNSRYIIHHDQTFSLGPSVVATANATPPINYSGAIPNELQLNIDKKLNFVTDYSRGNSGTITDIDTNSLYLVILSDATPATQQVNVDVAWNLCLVD